MWLSPQVLAKRKKEGRFGHDDFSYGAEQDRFRCPGGHWLLPSGKPRLQNNQPLQPYVSSQSDCRDYQLRGKCLSAKSQCREVWRGEYEADIQAVRQRMAAHPRAMAERSATVEHPFGTLKRPAGWDHFLVRGLEKVRGEWSLMALAYNFSRVLKLLGFDRFREICAQRMAKSAERRSTDHYWRLRKDGSGRFSEAFTRLVGLVSRLLPYEGLCRAMASHGV